MNMDARLLKLIRVFQATISRSLALFLERADLLHPFDWRTAGLSRMGELAGEPPIEYFFHGCGLWLKLGAEEVDFDFGLDGWTGGFTEYWLWEFARRRPAQFPEFQDRANLGVALAAAKQAGDVLHRRDGLEYLSGDDQEAA